MNGSQSGKLQAKLVLVVNCFIEGSFPFWSVGEWKSGSWFLTVSKKKANKISTGDTSSQHLPFKFLHLDQRKLALYALECVAECLTPCQPQPWMLQQILISRYRYSLQVFCSKQSCLLALKRNSPGSASLSLLSILPRLAASKPK